MALEIFESEALEDEFFKIIETFEEAGVFCDFFIKSAMPTRGSK